MFDFQGRFSAIGGDDNLSVEEIKRKMDDGNKLTLLDVREAWEHQVAKIDGSILIPLGQLEKRKAELQQDQEIICICHMGVRSYRAMKYLKSCGFKNVKNMAGGIEAWSLKVDSSVPRYR